MKSPFSPRNLVLIVAVVGGGILLSSPARRSQILGLIPGRGNTSQSVVLMMGQSWVDSAGASHGAFTILNEGTNPISRITVRCSALDDRGSALVERSRTFDAAPPIAQGGRAPFEMTIDVMAQTSVRMDCQISQAN